MKRTALLAVLLIACIVMFAGSAAAVVNPFTINKLLNDLNKNGVLYPEPDSQFVWFDDFYEFDANGANNAGWIATVDSSGNTSVVTDGAGGQLLITTVAVENSGVNHQWNAEIVNPNSSTNVEFEVKVKLSDEAQTSCMLGLFVTDTAVWATADTLGADVAYGIGFYKADGDSEWHGCVIDTLGYGNYTTADMGVYASDATWHTLRFEYNYSTGDVKWIVDGYLKATSSDVTYNPNTELAPTIAFDAGSAAAQTCTIDYMYVRSDR